MNYYIAMKAKSVFITLFLLIIAAFNGVKAQDRSFELKNSLLNFGVGFGWATNFYGDYSQLPSFTINYEKGLLYFKKAGYWGIGFLGGYHQAYLNYPNSNYEAQWQNAFATIRTTFHPVFLMSQHLDCYFALLGGVRYEFFKDTQYDSDPTLFVDNPHKKYGGLKTLFGGYFGMRYYPGERLGFFVEGGYGLSFVNMGITWKFGARNLQADPGIIKRGVTRPRF